MILIGKEKLSGGMFERETLVVTCSHCNGDTICKRGGSYTYQTYNGAGIAELSCNACVTTAQLPYRSNGYSNIICSICEGKGKVVL